MRPPVAELLEEVLKRTKKSASQIFRDAIREEAKKLGLEVDNEV